MGRKEIETIIKSMEDVEKLNYGEMEFTYKFCFWCGILG